jgi:environmental stress-induced protein Ves
MRVEVISQALFRQMPWANGGGVTTELVARRAQGADRILWRLSMAGVDTDGPFSHFAGYDRILVLLQGQGLGLRHKDGTEHELSNLYDMVSFPGDAETHATLTGGPVQDFNVIADRSTFRSAVSVVQSGNYNRVSVSASVLAVFAVDDDLVIADPDMGSHHLPKGDLLLVDGPQRGGWAFSGGTAIVVQILEIGELGSNPN